MNLAKISDKPFLLELIGRAKTMNLLTPNEYIKLRQECIEMSLNLAKKYYGITYCEDLRSASETVIGIVTLGLVVKFKNDIDLSLNFIKNRGMLAAFQIGWQEINNVVVLKSKVNDKKRDENLKDILEIASCSSTGICNNYNDLLDEKEKLDEIYKPTELLNFFYTNILFERVTKTEHGLDSQQFNTWFTQIALGLEPSLSFSKKNYIQLIKQYDKDEICPNQSHTKIKIWTLKNIPSIYENTWENMFENYKNIQIPKTNLYPGVEKFSGVIVLLKYIINKNNELLKIKNEKNIILKQIKEIQFKIFKCTGKFDLKSPSQIKHILFEKMKLPVITKTPQGKPSISIKALENLCETGATLPRLIIDYKNLNSKINDFTAPLADHFQSFMGFCQKNNLLIMSIEDLYN